jgi:hypothetical protein
MNKAIVIGAAALAVLAGLASAETKSGQVETLNLYGKKITITYASPAVNGRAGKIFTKDGLISGDAHYPVWRAGANNATTLHTEGDLDFGGGLLVPKGDYTLFVNIADPAAWELIVNKQTGQGGLDYDASQDLGRVKMTMSKPSSTVEQLKYSLANAGGNKGRLQLAWENMVGVVNFTVK